MAERESESTAFSLGKGAQIGKDEVGGHVPGRDVVVGTAPVDAASAQDLLLVLEVLKRLEEQIPGLAEAPTGLRDDAQDERIGQSLPAAVTLAHSVATLALRISGLG